MAGPSYVAKKIGDQYVVVPKEPTATRAGRAWLGAGGLLVLLGALRGGGRGWLSTLLGAALIYRGVTGCSIIQTLLRPRRHERDARDGSRMSPSFQNDMKPAKQMPLDEVDEASMESFPASDPPARNPLTSM